MSSFEVRDLVWCHGSRLWSLCRDLRSVSCEVLGVSFVVAHWSVVPFGLVFFDFFKFAESRIHVVQSGILRELRVTRSCIYAVQSGLLEFDSLLRLLPWMNCFFFSVHRLCSVRMNVQENACSGSMKHSRGAWRMLGEHVYARSARTMLKGVWMCCHVPKCLFFCLFGYLVPYKMSWTWHNIPPSVISYEASWIFILYHPKFFKSL